MIATRPAPRLTFAPITIKEQAAFVAQYHRHSSPRGSGKFAIQARYDDQMVGVALAGRPSARHLDDGLTVEVLRVCTDGTLNACSFLYGAVHRVAKAMGYRKAITYTLLTEPGSSVKAAGYTLAAATRPDDGQRPGRPRAKRDAVPRNRWELTL